MSEQKFFSFCFVFFFFTPLFSLYKELPEADLYCIITLPEDEKLLTKYEFCVKYTSGNDYGRKVRDPRDGQVQSILEQLSNLQYAFTIKKVIFPKFDDPEVNYLSECFKAYLKFRTTALYLLANELFSLHGSLINFFLSLRKRSYDSDTNIGTFSTECGTYWITARAPRNWYAPKTIELITSFQNSLDSIRNPINYVHQRIKLGLYQYKITMKFLQPLLNLLKKASRNKSLCKMIQNFVLSGIIPNEITTIVRVLTYSERTTLEDYFRYHMLDPNSETKGGYSLLCECVKMFKDQKIKEDLVALFVTYGFDKTQHVNDGNCVTNVIERIKLSGKSPRDIETR